jgi:hypothetical protein
VTLLIPPADKVGHFVFSNPLDVPLEIRGFSVLGLVLKVVEVRVGECTIDTRQGMGINFCIMLLKPLIQSLISDSLIDNPYSYKPVVFENLQSRGMSLVLMPHSELVAAVGLVGLDHIHVANEQHSLTGILLFEKQWTKSLKLVGWLVRAFHLLWCV